MQQKHKKNQDINKPCVDRQPWGPILNRNQKEWFESWHNVHRQWLISDGLLQFHRVARSWAGPIVFIVKYLATYGWLKRIVTIFSPHLMDLSYLILKETAANTAHPRKELIIILNGHYHNSSEQCNVSLIWVLLTKQHTSSMTIFVKMSATHKDGTHSEQFNSKTVCNQ